MMRNFKLLGSDFVASIVQWRFWFALGWNDIAKQYRRSFLGPLWISLNTGFFVVAFGLVGAQLFKVDLATYLPYFAVGHVFFGFFSLVMNEACQAFVQAEGYLKHAASPKLIHVFRGVLRNLLALAHNFLILAAVLAWSGGLAKLKFFYFILALALCAVAAFLAMGIVATICTRFRDVPMIISSVMQVMFFLTPVMWRPDQLTERAQWLVTINPFALFLDLARKPLLGETPPVGSYVDALMVVALLLLIFVPIMAWARGKLVYWI